MSNLSRRNILVGGTSLGLINCSGVTNTFPASQDPLPGTMGAGAVTGGNLGTGAVKVGLILPLSAQGSAGQVAANLRNAAELALSEFTSHDLTLFVKDDGGTAAGAAAAAESLLREGAELILGPLFAESVRAAGAICKAANRPMIAFTTDPSAAAQGIYLLSFLTEPAVNRVVRYALSQNKRSFAALVGNDPSGQISEAAFQQAVSANSGRMMSMQRYSDPSKINEAARKLSAVMSQIDCVFVPDPMGGQTITALKQAGIDPAKVQFLGAGQWDGNAQAAQAAPNAWYAAADGNGFRGFASKYRNKFGADPVRIASLGYDAVSLAAGLSKAYGANRFTQASLTNSSGFAGIDGTFRFRPDGMNERALAVLKASGGVVSPASKSFA